LVGNLHGDYEFGSVWIVFVDRVEVFNEGIKVFADYARTSDFFRLPPGHRLDSSLLQGFYKACKLVAGRQYAALL
jgi:hypothetical protein